MTLEIENETESSGRRRSNQPGRLRRSPLQLLMIWIALSALISPSRTHGQQSGFSSDALPPLTSAAQIQALSGSQADLHRPARVRGVVTYFSAADWVLFVQDETGGIYVDPGDKPPRLRSGDLVEVEGRTASGAFAPDIERSSVKVVGIAPLPSPKRASIQELFAATLDSQWVELEGVIREVETVDNHTSILISASGGQIRALLPGGSENELANLADSLVAVRGVSGGIYNSKNQLIGTQIYVPAWGDLRIKEPAPADPFALPLRHINRLQELATARGFSRRIRVRGVVSLAMLGVSLFMREEMGGLYISSRQKTPLAPGDLVDVVGFPESNSYTPSLRNAIFRRIGRSSPPVPSTPDPRGVQSGAFDAELIQIEGYLLGHSLSPVEEVLAVQSDYLTFNAILPLDGKKPVLSSLAAGSRLRLTGVCSVQADEFRRPIANRLLLRDKNDVKLVSRPTWWTLKYTLIAAGLMLLMILASLVWVVVLNRRVREQTEIIRHRLEREAALVNQLQQSQKMEAIGSLAGGVAHDFNNLLTAILGYTEIMLGRIAPGDPMKEDLETVHKAGERAASLTRQLLAFSRRQLMHPRVLNLNAVVNDIDRMLRRLIGEDIEFSTNLAPGLGNVKADPSQIEQVIMNLVVNARDALPKGGKVSIETSNVELTESRIGSHTELQPGRYVQLTVSDNGSGIDRETLGHIFEPFFTTKKKGNGTGLGLATVYGIVKQSGGDISVYSEVGQGTTFKTYLPRVDDAPAIEELPKTQLPSRGTESILLVEDDLRVRALTQRVLEDSGYNVLTAGDGMEAIEICKKQGGIQLIVTDVVMPKLSGRELVEQISAIRPRMRFLYMSGYTDDTIVRHGVLEKGIPFLQKPYSPGALMRMVREVLDTP